ncbi:hypothetical protein ACOSQ4_007803 [Xanthoceras sorbifolium]
METRGKTNVEFRNEANETLGRHESNFDQLNGTLQTVLTELQSLRIAQNFLARLKDEVRLDVKVKQPRSLANAIGIARLIEERNALQRKNHQKPMALGDFVWTTGPLTTKS